MPEPRFEPRCPHCHHAITECTCMSAFNQDLVTLTMGYAGETDDLRQQLADAQARIAALEGALRAMVDNDGYWRDDGWTSSCGYCGRWDDSHEPDCSVVKAQQLLDQNLDK